MAFAGSTALQLLIDCGLGGGPRIWRYTSSDGSTDIASIAGYFSGMGRGSVGGLPVGMSTAGPDVVMNIENASGAKPNRITFHQVSGSTANYTQWSSTAGYDVTVGISST